MLAELPSDMNADRMTMVLSNDKVKSVGWPLPVITELADIVITCVILLWYDSDILESVDRRRTL